MSLHDLILRPKPDPLSAGTVPGTRKVNNLPLFLVGGVLLVFAGVMAMVMVKRADQATRTEQDKPKSASAATQFATELTGPWTTGMVPSADTPPPPAPLQLPEPGKMPDLPLAQTPQNLPVIPTIPTQPRTPPDGWGEARDRFRNSRMQAFETALKSRTGVQASGLAAGRSSARVAAPRSAEEVRNQIDATRQQLATRGADPMAAYQARLAGLTSGGSGGSGASSSGASLGSGQGSGQPQFARDNWTLPELVAAPAPFTVQAGFVIPAMMISGINSNLPGQVMAQVSQNVYDTPTGRYLLIPQGTRLIGTYNSDVAYGQERVLMAWQRLLFPDGRTLNIQAMPGADEAGNAGFTDDVNNHYIRTFSSAFLLSGVIAAASMSQKSDSGDSNDRSNQQRASDSLSESLGQTLGSTMAEMIRKNLNIAPTLHIRPGYRFNVMVTKDMLFDGPYGR